MRRTVSLLVALLLVVGGCARTNTPASGPSIPGPVPSPKPSAISDLEFQRQGGFAGLWDDLVVHGDGTFTVTRTRPALTRSGQLDVTDHDSLVKELDRARLGEVPPAASGGVADGY